MAALLDAVARWFALAVGCSGDGKVYVIDTSNHEVLYDETF